jgi:hypothetical protein
MNLTKIMFSNKHIKLCLEILRVGLQTSTLLIYQYIDGCLHLLPRSTLNIKFERFLKQFHKTWITTSPDAPEGILHADEQCCWHQDIIWMKIHTGKEALAFNWPVKKMREDLVGFLNLEVIEDRPKLLDFNLKWAFRKTAKAWDRDWMKVSQ